MASSETQPTMSDEFHPTSPSAMEKSEAHLHDSTQRMVNNAKRATDAEQKMTLMQGIRLYPKAVGWSILISTCICMEGYDVCLLSNFCES